MIVIKVFFILWIIEYELFKNEFPLEKYTNIDKDVDKKNISFNYNETSYSISSYENLNLKDNYAFYNGYSSYVCDLLQYNDKCYLLSCHSEENWSFDRPKCNNTDTILDLWKLTDEKSQV